MPHGPDFLRVCDLSGPQVEQLLTDARRFKLAFDRRMTSTELDGRRVAFIWDGEGFRNRVAFELGVPALGGVGVEIPGRLGARETLEDLAGYLDNWFDLIVVRTPSFEGARDACRRRRGAGGERPDAAEPSL